MKYTNRFLQAGCAALYCLAGAGQLSAASEPDITTQFDGSDSYSAKYSLSRLQSGQKLQQFDLLVSPFGYRVKPTSSANSAEVMVNTSIGKMWLLDRRRRLFHTVPIEKKYSVSAVVHAKNRNAVSLNSDPLTDHLEKILPQEPCQGASEKQSHTTHSNTGELQIWSCYDGGYLYEKQWFDTSLQWVVRAESFDGMLSEISDITNIELSAEHFFPPKNFRSVSLDEIFETPVKLLEYE